MDKYVGINIHEVGYLLSTFQVDVYVKLSDEKHVKVYQKGNPVDEEIFARIKAKGVTQLFLLEEDHKLWLAEKDKMNRPVEIDHERVISMASDFASLRSTIIQLGVDQTKIEGIETINKEAFDMMKKRPKFKDLLGLKDRDLSFAHSMLSASICGHAVGNLFEAGSLVSDDSSTLALSTAAFVHNLNLNNDQLKASIEQMNNPQTREIKDHPRGAADLAMLLPSVSPDLHKIVIQHHENCHGTGYPYKANPKTMIPLSILFMLVDRLVDKIVQTQFTREDLLKAVDEVEFLFVDGRSFKEAITAIRKGLSAEKLE